MLIGYLTTLCSVVVGFIFCFRKGKPLHIKLFPIYSLISIIQMLSAYTIGKTAASYIMNFFPLFEFGIFAFFFVQVLKTTRIKIIVLLSGIILALDFLGISITADSFTAINIGNVYLLESALLLVPCIMYFKELFTAKSTVILSTDPTFWIATGILILSACSIPVSLFFYLKNLEINQDPSLDNSLRRIYFFLYAIMCALFVKSFLCRTRTLE
jgi:hypothetical protein